MNFIWRRADADADTAGANVTLSAYFGEWSERQVWAETTATAMALAVRHCTFADVTLGAIRGSTVETWGKDMQRRNLAPGTMRARKQRPFGAALGGS